MITITDKWNQYLRKSNNTRNDKTNIQSEQIIQYCMKYNIKYREIANKQIKKNLSIFLDGYVFCGMTDMYNFMDTNGLKTIIPDTYPTIFNGLYKRKIQKIKYQDISTLSYPYFVKSIGNDKMINGTVVHDNYELINLIYSSCENTDNLELYVSEIVHFVSEYRLLIGNKILYGVGHQFGRIDIKPDNEFIKEIISLSNKEFLCIDIGFIKSSAEWAIVEINPPFSIVDYGIPADAYIGFAIDFWKKVMSTMRKNNSEHI